MRNLKRVQIENIKPHSGSKNCVGLIKGYSLLLQSLLDLFSLNNLEDERR